MSEFGLICTDKEHQRGLTSHRQKSRVHETATHDEEGTTMAGRIKKVTSSTSVTEAANGAVVIDITEGARDSLTKRQIAILEMIRDTTESRGYPPSVREIGEAVGLTSPSSVAHQLKNLQL